MVYHHFEQHIMAPRTRNRRPYRSFNRVDGVLSPPGQIQYAESITESSVPGPCNVVHTHSTPMDFGFYLGATHYESLSAGPFPRTPPPPRLANWKLPTTSEFSIIQFFAELDDTIAIFSKKFWREFSYGAFTWGIIPFVNDIKAILKTIKGLSANLGDIEYEDSYSLNWQDEVYSVGSGVFATGTGKVSYHLTGKVAISEVGNQAQIFLDRIGFHPDLSTAWDLVPLSFLLTDILPIADFLSSLHNRGWVQQVCFQGWQSQKVIQSMKLTRWDGTSNLHSTVGQQLSYNRGLCSIPLSIAPSNFKPSAPEMDLRTGFNMAYIAGAHRLESKVRQGVLSGTVGPKKYDPKVLISRSGRRK